MADRHRPGAARPPNIWCASKLRVGKVAAGIYREFHARFLQVAGELGFDPKSAELQWWAVAKVAALAGVSPERLTKAQLDTGRDAADRCDPPAAPDHPMRARPLTTTVARRRGDVVSRRRDRRPAAQTPLGQVRRSRAAVGGGRRRGYARRSRDTSSRCASRCEPATMVRVEAVLREFAVWLTAQAPEVTAVSDLRRAHIERYKRHLAQRPSVRGGGRLSNIGLAEHLGTLRVCLDRLSEWDGEDAPDPRADVRR